MAKSKARIDSREDAKAALRKAEKALAKALSSEKKLAEGHRKRIAELAHEIKTPLTAMMGFAEIMKDERFGPIGNKAYVDQAKAVHAAATHILGVCENLLVTTAKGKRKPQIVKQEVDVRALVGDVVKVFAEMAKQRGVDLRSCVPAAFPKLRTDPVRLRQVLFNVISNAVKFTPGGGRVSVSGKMDPRDGAVLLIIQDEGKGMSDSEIVKMLKPYTHDPAASPHGDRGIGLGLSTSSAIMKELGGTLELSSVLNVGSVVTLRLPM